eukprot:759461-Hanusia_phi.AAC.2
MVVVLCELQMSNVGGMRIRDRKQVEKQENVQDQILDTWTRMERGRQEHGGQTVGRGLADMKRIRYGMREWEGGRPEREGEGRREGGSGREGVGG